MRVNVVILVELIMYFITLCKKFVFLIVGYGNIVERSFRFSKLNITENCKKIHI